MAVQLDLKKAQDLEELHRLLRYFMHSALLVDVHVDSGADVDIDVDNVDVSAVLCLV